MYRTSFANSLPYLCLAFCCCLFVGIAAVQEAAAEESADPLMKAERGYMFGVDFGSRLLGTGNQDVDLEQVLEGIRDSLAGRAPKLTQAQQEAAINLVRARQQEQAEKQRAKQAQQGKENLMAGKEFLAANAKKKGVRVTASGLQYLVLEAADGPSPVASDTVVVHYEGRLTSEETFDSSRARGTPAEFGLRQVIAGWTEGLQLMQVGSKYRLFIPSDLGYGPGGTGSIPPNSVLIFDVELLDIKN